MSTQNYLINQPNYDFLKKLGLKERNHGCFVDEWSSNGEIKKIISPIDRSVIAEIQNASQQDYERAVKATKDAQKIWRNITPPVRGKIDRK